MFSRILLFIAISFTAIFSAYADVDLTKVVGENLASRSMAPNNDGDALMGAQNLALGALYIAKVIIAGIALIYMVFIGITMVIAQGNEEDIKKGQRQIMYSLVGFMFLNIPGSIYELFAVNNARPQTALGGTVSPNSWSTRGLVEGSSTESNLFVNYFSWNNTVTSGILIFLRVAVIGFVVFNLTLAAFTLLSSGGDEEKRKEAKNKFLYSILAMVFLGFIELFISFVYEGNISTGKDLFSQITNLLLYFAGPVGIFFVILGGYYILTSAGDEERVKKGKSILFNTAVGVLILLASITFLKDLSGFNLG